ncbi:MAG: peptidoglycan-binding protein [Nitrospirota bacterium]|nr:peptidoglycan-binding protein [Nitrospirota bacterium]MDH5586277.1 peptidoglycan-binding protein [Nitrospirota bacterium]MDH5775461.1 peptidoglycan-binding protein [Nitrospirota bacterium]
MPRMIIVVVTLFVCCHFELGYFPLSASAADAPPVNAPRASSAMKQKAEQDLAMLRKNPEDFRTLITGVQIFLGRFGYGIGPFTGKLDEATKQALTAYQTKTGLSVTGDINFETLQRLTEDDQVLNRIVPYLPPFQARNEEWEKWIDVKGSWMLKEGNTDDVLHTSRITCMQEFQRCIDSTATLMNGSAPQLQVHTHVYDVKEWDDNKIVSLPYDGEACAISILRISKNPLVVTRFVSLQSSPGPCAKVKPEDRQYVLDDGPTIYQALKVQKSQSIQQILQVAP